MLSEVGYKKVEAPLLVTLTDFQKKSISSFPKLKPLVKAHRNCALTSPDSVKAKEPTTHFFIREIDQLCLRDNRVAREAVVPPTVVIRARVPGLLNDRC